MMTIQTLKAEATRRGHFYDNKEKAMANWSKTWGLGTWWKDRWAYKEYTLGDFCMRVGNVYHRHGSYRHDDYFYKGESVSRNFFPAPMSRRLHQRSKPISTSKGKYTLFVNVR